MYDRTKIYFPIQSKSPHGITGEWLWAKRLRDGRYVIDNTPFNVYGISNNDIVLAREIEGVLTFESVSHRGGHSTYRILLPINSSHEKFLTLWPRFKKLNCTFEGTTEKQGLYSIDVPPQTDVSAVYKLLEKGENEGKFEFEEAHYCNPKDRN